VQTPTTLQPFSGAHPVLPGDLRDASCFSGDRNLRVPYEPLRRAVGMLGFVAIGSEDVPHVHAFCSGGLLNNRRNDGTPYFLTANHCFVGHNQRDATQEDILNGTVVVWDYFTSACVAGPPPPTDPADFASLPQSAGATLLAARWAND